MSDYITEYEQARENGTLEARPAEEFFAELENDSSPCDLCSYSPPSSFDGKPCSICPAEPKTNATQHVESVGDYISRQAAIDFIDAGYLCNPNEPRWSDNEVVNFLKSRPSAQPEVIRCKDCKYMTEHYDTDGNAPYWTCSEWDSGTDYDGFCHYAERRTDG